LRIDQYWLGGPDKHMKRTTLRSVILLRREPVAPAVEELSAQSALALLDRFADANCSAPFLNPYLLVGNSARIEQRRQMYSWLFSACKVFAINTAAGPAQSAKAYAQAILQSGKV
jgi:hypothetical protein